MPAMPGSEVRLRFANIGMTGIFSSLAVPCCRNRRPVMMRSTLSRRGAHVAPSASKFTAVLPKQNESITHPE